MKTMYVCRNCGEPCGMRHNEGVQKVQMYGAVGTWEWIRYRDDYESHLEERQDLICTPVLVIPPYQKELWS